MKLLSYRFQSNFHRLKPLNFDDLGFFLQLMILNFGEGIVYVSAKFIGWQYYQPGKNKQK